jgi:hypothetical protein
LRTIEQIGSDDLLLSRYRCCNEGRWLSISQRPASTSHGNRTTLKEKVMKLAMTLTTSAVLMLALSGAAFAVENRSPQNVPGTSVEGNAMENSPAAITSPEANKSDRAPASANKESGDAAANVPGTPAEGNSAEAEPSLSGEKSAPPVQGAGESGRAAANIPGAKADQRSSESDPSLGSEPKDK